MTARQSLMTGALVLALLIPAAAAAQSAASSTQSALPSKLWIVGGGGSASFLVDCSECGDPEDYHHTGGVLINAGRAVNKRIDVGAEVFWVKSTSTGSERARTTFLLAASQFRPWQSQGFFVKGGIGISFIRNSVTPPDQAPHEFVTKAFSVAVGTGWEWRLRNRFGAQVFASQHVAAAGDIVTNAGTAQNVMVNYWSIGGAIVIR